MCVQVFAIFGFLSPANRGGLMTALLLLYVFNGAFGGYCAARLYKMFNGQNPTRTTILTAVSFPSIVFIISFTVNLFVWHSVRVAAPSWLQPLRCVLALTAACLAGLELCDPVWHHACAACAVAWGVNAFGVPRSVLWGSCCAR